MLVNKAFRNHYLEYTCVVVLNKVTLLNKSCHLNSRTQVRTPVRTQTYVRMYARTHAHTPARPHARTHTCTHARTFSHALMHFRRRTHLQAHAPTHTHTITILCLERNSFNASNIYGYRDCKYKISAPLPLTFTCRWQPRQQMRWPTDSDSVRPVLVLGHSIISLVART